VTPAGIVTEVPEVIVCLKVTFVWSKPTLGAGNTEIPIVN
jgi:hypothetical protein